MIPARNVEDHFIAALTDSVAGPLVAGGLGVFIRVVDDDLSETDLYHRWAESEGIVGVILLGQGQIEARVRLLNELGMPFVAVAERGSAGDFPAVVVDDAETARVISTFLTTRPHERAVYFAGSFDPAEAASRAQVFGIGGEIIQAKHDGDAARAARSIIEAGPATLLFDRDTQAVAVATSLREHGVEMKTQVAIMSLTDSALCRSSDPSITAVDRRGSEIGELLGRRMLATIAGGAIGIDHAPVPFIVRRESA